MSKKVLAIQSDNCTGCHLCELACSNAKEGVFIPSQSRIKVVTDGLGGWSRPVVCVQCEDPMCMKACSAEAIYKTETSKGENLVKVDREKCTGCHQCVVACPFGAMEYLKKQKAIKCDLCGGTPACVDYCFYDCLHYIELSDDDYRKRSNKIKALTTKLCREISIRKPHQRRVLLSVEDLLNKV